MLETQETLKVNHPVLEEMFLQTTINMVVHHDRLFNPICGQQGLSVTLLGICLDTMDLCHMSPPLLLSIVHLKRNGLVWLTRSPMSVSYPGLQFHNPG